MAFRLPSSAEAAALRNFGKKAERPGKAGLSNVLIRPAPPMVTYWFSNLHATENARYCDTSTGTKPP